MIVEHRFDHILQDGRRGRAWIASLAPLADVRLAEGVTVPLGAFHHYRRLGQVALAAFETPAQTVERPERLVVAEALDHLVLRTCASGRARIEAGGQVSKAGPGDLTVLDLARPVRIEAEASTGAALFVPRRCLSDRPDDVPVPHGRVMADGHPLGRLVADHLRNLAACLPTGSPEESDHLATATLDLVRALLPVPWAGAGPPGVNEVGRVLAMRRFIDANIDTVDVPMLMERFGLSRAPLYRRFAADGGIHAYIRDRRLAVAMRRLTQPTEDRRPMVARLAHECGFANARVFSRVFHRRYGLWPAEVASAHPRREGSAPDAAPMTWLRDL